MMNVLIDTIRDRQDLIVDAFLQHIFLSFIALAIAVLIALPLGLFVSKYRKLAEPIIGVTAILQTIPSLALLGSSFQSSASVRRRRSSHSSFTHCCRSCATSTPELRASIRQSSKREAAWG